jgi:hypothetical protein
MTLLARLRELLAQHPEGLNVEETVPLLGRFVTRRKIQQAYSHLASAGECTREMAAGDDQRRRRYRPIAHAPQPGAIAVGVTVRTPSRRLARVASVGRDRVRLVYVDDGSQVALAPALLTVLPQSAAQR